MNIETPNSSLLHRKVYTGDDDDEDIKGQGTLRKQFARGGNEDSFSGHVTFSQRLPLLKQSLPRTPPQALQFAIIDNLKS